MRYSTFALAALSLLVSCSTVTKPSSEDKKLFGNSVLDDKMYGDPLPEWSKFSGIKDGRLYTVGYAEYSVNKSETYVKKAAIMDGEIKLISDAPADFRVITQNSLLGSGIESGEFNQIQTKLQEVIGSTGFKGHDETCRKIVRHMESHSSIFRGCWVAVSANISDLRKAYQLTLERKYGVGKASKFDDLMNQELNKINNLNRFTTTSHKE